MDDAAHYSMGTSSSPANYFLGALCEHAGPVLCQSWDSNNLLGDSQALGCPMAPKYPHPNLSLGWDFTKSKTTLYFQTLPLPDLYENATAVALLNITCHFGTDEINLPDYF